jgi:FtsP/CotA-like multicopper oxidase with cupredoxin domain
MRLSRRGVVAGLSALAARPQLSFAQAEDGFTVVTAEAKEIQLLEPSGPPTAAWQFSQPVLRAKQGEEARFRFVNKLGVEVWLHWFGVRGPDAVMTIDLPADESLPQDCVFTPPDAGTFWLGPLANASQMRDMGLSAMLVVEGPGDDKFVDQPMVLDDWMLGEDGVIEAGFGDLKVAIAEGRLGNWFTLNGLYRPEITVPSDKLVRLRFLNTANVRTMRVLFKGPQPWLVALDGQPVAAQQLEKGALALAPGQRSDLLLDANAEELVLGLDLFEETAELAHITRQGSAGVALVTPGFSLPANPFSSALDLASAQVVPVVLQGGAKGGMTKAKLNGVEMDLRGLLEQGKAWAINGVVGPAQASLGQMAQGKTVVLDIDNQTAFDQPLHIHGHVWQVIEDAGQLLTTPQPWRDTAVINARGRQKLGFVADNPGVWVLQSLVAERCDSGLISAFEVG